MNNGIDLYIKMCDCPEIQGQRITTIGNHYFDKVTQAVLIVGQWYPGQSEFQFNPINFDLSLDSYVWLPSQEQIQGMLNIKTGYFLLHSFFNKAFKENVYFYYREKSIDQIWVCFYMQEKHEKIWDRNKWIKPGQQEGVNP